MRRILVAALLEASPALAQERELSTDRPDKTESRHTVPRGRGQIEMDLANYTSDRADGVRTETVGVAPFNLKLGLDRAIDIQLVVAPSIHRTTVGQGEIDQLGLYTEMFTERGDRWIVTGDVGVTYGIGEDTQLDAGVNLGLTDAADDVAVFVGLSRRF